MQPPQMNGHYFIPPQPQPNAGYYGYPAAGYAQPPPYQPQVQLVIEIIDCLVNCFKMMHSTLCTFKTSLIPTIDRHLNRT